MNKESRSRLETLLLQAQLLMSTNSDGHHPSYELAYQARTGAGMSQEQLAELVGVETLVIAQVEEANYEGASLLMLQRIADALHQRIAINFVPAGEHQEVM